jgi:hypothetical protein
MGGPAVIDVRAPCMMCLPCPEPPANPARGAGGMRVWAAVVDLLIAPRLSCFCYASRCDSRRSQRFGAIELKC